MKRIFLVLISILFTTSAVFADDSNVINLSLNECLKMAVERNINIKMVRIEKEKNKYKESETRSILLPKVNLTGSFQDYIKLPTTVLPGDMIGRPGTTMPIQMGTHFNTSLTASMSMVLYNQTALTALQLSKKMTGISDLSIEKASEELALEIAKLYFLTLTTSQQKEILEKNIARTQKIKDITKILVDNGMGKQVDYNRVSVSIENLYTQLNNVNAAQEQQYNMIKYMLDIPLEKVVVLTDKSELQLLNSEPTMRSDFSNHVDIQLLEYQKELNALNQSVVKSGYLPSLAIAGQYAFQGMRNSFKNYFNDSPENKWYSMSLIGLNLSIPIFDGLEKNSKLQQIKLDYEKTEEQLANTKQRFNVNYQNALTNYNNSKSNVERQKLNIELAEKIYDETSLKYREGVATMSNLLQDEMSLSSAQSNYLNALYSLKESELKLISISGEIKKLINSK